MAQQNRLGEKLHLWTGIKRLARKTIGVSKSELMTDTVIGLLINKVEFRLDIHAKIQVWLTTKFTLYAQQQDKT